MYSLIVLEPFTWQGAYFSLKVINCVNTFGIEAVIQMCSTYSFITMQQFPVGNSKLNLIFLCLETELL